MDRRDRSVSRGFDDDKFELDVDFDVVLLRIGISETARSEGQPQISFPRPISVPGQTSALNLPALPRSTFNPASPAPLASPASPRTSP